MTSAQLRGLGVNDVRELLHKLGLDVEGIEDKNAGLTRLFEHAIEVDEEVED